LLASYKLGARSIEAVIEASSASDRSVYGLPELIAPSAARIHAAWRTELEREVDSTRKEHKLMNSRDTILNCCRSILEKAKAVILSTESCSVHKIKSPYTYIYS
jgi:hypothetical protein